MSSYCPAAMIRRSNGCRLMVGSSYSATESKNEHVVTGLMEGSRYLAKVGSIHSIIKSSQDPPGSNMPPIFMFTMILQLELENSNGFV